MGMQKHFAITIEESFGWLDYIGYHFAEMDGSTVVVFESAMSIEESVSLDRVLNSDGFNVSIHLEATEDAPFGHIEFHPVYYR